jgi:DNA-binding SARP family transcriptional activator
LSADAADAWGVLPAVHDEPEPHGPALRLEVLDGLRVVLGGEVLEASRWSSRRKPRVALAVLAAKGGRVSRSALVECVWHGEELDPERASTRLSTVLSVLRTALDAGRAQGADARSLVLHDATVELSLARGDALDVHELRAITAAAAAADPRDRAAYERLADAALPLVSGEPLRHLRDEPALAPYREQLRRELADAAAAVARGWLAATSPDAGLPPASLLELSGHGVRHEPLDERMTALEIELLGRAGRVVDASRSFHRLRELLANELGLRPSRELVRQHAALVGVDE